MADDQQGGIGPLSSVPREYRKRSYRHTASWVFYGAFIAIIVGQGPFVIRQLGGSALQSLAINLGRALPLVFALLWVPFVERHNPVRLTGLLLAAGGLLLIASGFTSRRWTLVLVLAAGMVLVTSSRPTLGSSLRQVYPDQWRGKLLSLPQTSAMLARVVCLVVVGRLLHLWIDAYRVVFPAAGVCLLAAAVLFRGIGGSRGREAAGDEPPGTVLQQVAESLKSPLHNRLLLVFLIGYFFVASGGVAYGNALPIFAKDELQLSPEQWGYARAAYMGAMLLSFYFWGGFLDRHSAPATMVLCWLMMSTTYGALFFVDTWPPFLGLMALRGLFMAGNILAFFPLVMHFTESEDTIRGMGLHFSLWGIRWMLMVSFVIWVVDGRLFPLRYVFLLSLALTAVGLAIMTAAWRKDRAETA